MQSTSLRRIGLRAGAALALSLGAVAGVAGAAGASGHHHSWGHHDSGAVAGAVTAASPTSITITERSGTSATFTIDSTTKVTEGSAVATAAALATGERVVITPSTTTASLAASIAIRLSRVEGKVSAVNGNTISVTVEDGLSQSVVVSSTTAFTKGGASATLADVVVGSKIEASGVVNTGANALEALSVRISAPRVNQAWVVGKVAAVNGNNISVALRNGLTLLVVVSSTTTYTLNGASATLANVTVGVYVRAAGTVDTTANALDASSVRIGGDGAGHDASAGLSAEFTLGGGVGAGFGFGGHDARRGGHGH